MASIRKVFIYFLIFFTLLQFIIAYAAPPKVIYDYRMDYEIVKNRITNIEAVFSHVKSVIEKENLKDYYIILGDSVAFSRPGPVTGSIGYYLNEKATAEGKNIRIFNLSMPAMQMGDIYTVLLKMKQYGISNDHVIINVLYSGFIQRDEEHPIVTWLPMQMKELDRASYDVAVKYKVHEKKSRVVKKTPILKATDQMKAKVYETVPIFKYKDYLQQYFLETYSKIRGKGEEPQIVQPWYEKKFLIKLMKQAPYQRDFSDTEFVMNETNTQIYFLNKIIEMQKGKDTLFFLAAVNEELMKENTEKPGYKANLQKIDNFFADKPVQYINLNGKIPFNIFSDHVHLTPKGYKYLSELLWKETEKW